MNIVKRVRMPGSFLSAENLLVEADGQGFLVQSYNLTAKQHWVNPSYLNHSDMDKLQPISSPLFVDKFHDIQLGHLAQVITNTGNGEIHNDWIVITDGLLNGVNRLLSSYNDVGQITDDTFNKAVGELDWMTIAPCYVVSLPINVTGTVNRMTGHCIIVIGKQENIHEIFPSWVDHSTQLAMYVGNPPPNIHAFDIRSNRNM